MIYRTNSNSLKNAKVLRKNSTPEERIFWKHFRGRRFFGFKFRRQEPIGKYIADFICFEIKLIIELEGGQHNFEANKEYDLQRTQFLESCGFKVIRFWNNQINYDLENVLSYILQECRKRSPSMNEDWIK